MSDWQVGDLALCVDVKPRLCGRKLHKGDQLQMGQVYRVLAVMAADCGNCVGLVFEEVEAISGRFRKIKPDQHEACEPEFVTLLKRAKHPVSA